MIAFSYEYYLLGSNITKLKSNKTDFDLLALLTKRKFFHKIHNSNLYSVQTVYNFALSLTIISALYYKFCSKDSHECHTERCNVRVSSIRQSHVSICYPSYQVQRPRRQLSRFQRRLPIQDLQKCWRVRREVDPDARYLLGKTCLHQILPRPSCHQ